MTLKVIIRKGEFPVQIAEISEDDLGKLLAYLNIAPTNRTDVLDTDAIVKTVKADPRCSNLTVEEIREFSEIGLGIRDAPRTEDTAKERFHRIAKAKEFGWGKDILLAGAGHMELWMIDDRRLKTAQVTPS